MQTSSDIHVAYNNLYEAMMQIIWPWQVVTALARLELATYKAFPNYSEIIKQADKLIQCIKTSDRSQSNQLNDIIDLITSLKDIASESSGYSYYILQNRLYAEAVNE